MKEILFYFAGAGAILAALMVLYSKNIVHSALYLAGAFIAIALLYLTLETPFLAAVQVLIYVGGVITLILFAIMLTKENKSESKKI